MTYESVDKLQNTLASSVFKYAKDRKKASGRALGTFVEIITFYLLESWGFSKNITIEKGLIEFGNDSISHNVEYTLHPIDESNLQKIQINSNDVPITSSKMFSLGNNISSFEKRNNTLLTTNKVLRNSCMIGSKENKNLLSIIDIDKSQKDKLSVSLIQQYKKPFAMVECKRVGVEEGTKKGPQTIEKAKQGAYVAKTVSSLQKIRNNNGILYGIIPEGNGKFCIKPYKELIKEVINSDNPLLYKDFILTVGVVSNHGNWFTSENPNKELLVLSQAYDWLIFLTDEGISQFIDELLLNPTKEYEIIKNVFLSSYQNRTTKNQFTKVQMQYDAHILLLKYFKENKTKINRWFNVITPKNSNLNDLQHDLGVLSNKKWGDIL